MKIEILIELLEKINDRRCQISIKGFEFYLLSRVYFWSETLIWSGSHDLFLYSNFGGFTSEGAIFRSFEIESLKCFFRFFL